MGKSKKPALAPRVRPLPRLSIVASPVPQAKEFNDEVGEAEEKKRPEARILASFFSLEAQMVKELECLARDWGELTEDQHFPEQRARELREKFIGGMFDWAVRCMATDLESYLQEGAWNFLDHLKVHHGNPDRAEPRTRHDRFWGPFEKAEFRMPLKFRKRMGVHHSEWPQAWRIYEEAKTLLQDKRLRKLKRESRVRYLLALKEAFPGIPDNVAEYIRTNKASDAAARYTCWKLKLPVGVQSLKKYLKPFHNPPYGYFDFIVRHLNRLK